MALSSLVRFSTFQIHPDRQTNTYFIMLARSLGCVRCRSLARASSSPALPSLIKVSSSSFTSPFSSSALAKNDAPWYLNPEESPSVTSPLKQIEIPDLPENHPQTLENLVVYLAQELGIDDLLVFDMRNKKHDDSVAEGAYDMADFMILGTGKSAKHLQKASTQLDFYIKHNLHQLPLTEGILKSGVLARYHRRLQKKGKKAPNYSKNTYGAEPNTWVMTDTKSDGIIIHMLTEERRVDLNLEYLWSDASEREKYERSHMRKDSDDIFRGIRYFHSSAFQRENESAFDVYDITFDNYSSHFQKLLKLHIVEPKSTPLAKIKEHLDLMYSAGLAINPDLLYSYFNTILQSDEFNSKLKSEAEAFKRRDTLFSNIIQKYNIKLTTEEVLKFIPLLIVSGSQIDNTLFRTIKDIIENPEIGGGQIVRHSKTINHLMRLSNKVADSLNVDHRAMKREIDLLLVSVYANRQNWIHFNQVIQAAIIRNDLSILKAALPLVTACADLKTAVEFNDRVLPLLLEAGLDTELEQFVDLLAKRISNP